MPRGLANLLYRSEYHRRRHTYLSTHTNTLSPIPVVYLCCIAGFRELFSFRSRDSSWFKCYPTQILSPSDVCCLCGHQPRQKSYMDNLHGGRSQSESHHGPGLVSHNWDSLTPADVFVGVGKNGAPGPFRLANSVPALCAVARRDHRQHHSARWPTGLDDNQRARTAADNCRLSKDGAMITRPGSSGTSLWLLLDILVLSLYIYKTDLSTKLPS